MLVHKTYKVRLYPNKAQEQELFRILVACRWTWNYFLKRRQDQFLLDGTQLKYRDLSRELSILRHTQQELQGVRSMPVHQTLRRLDVAYNRFFRKISRQPKPKTEWLIRESFQKSKDWRIEGGKILVQKGLVLKYRGKLPSENVKRLGTLVVSLVARGQWYASITVQEEIKAPRRHSRPIGIDLGLISLATTSKGEKFTVERYPLHKKIARLRRKLAKQEIGSGRRELTLRQLAKLENKARNIRLDNMHKVTSEVLRKNPSLVAIEDLSTKNMLKNHRLAKSIADASWGEFARQIKYKTAWRGGEVVEIDRFFPSSKTCSKCFHKKEDMKLSDREWDCENCGTHHDRDVNAAKMILIEATGRGTPRAEVVIG